MPCYEWSCKECGHEFEALQKMGTPFDGDANRLTLSVVKVAVTKLPGVKVIHC